MMMMRTRNTVQMNHLTSQREERDMCQATTIETGMSSVHAKSSLGRPLTPSMLETTTRGAYATSGERERLLGAFE